MKGRFYFRNIFRSNFFIASFQATSVATRVEREELIYPFSSLVAEFGGTLGLFLGFSFLGLWDELHSVRKCLAFVKEKINTKN